MDSTIHGLIGKLPLVLEPAFAINAFKGGDSHDEVIKECGWNFDESTIHVIDPSLIYDKVSFGCQDIVSVEDDLAEVDIRDEALHSECDVPPIEAFVDDSCVYVELNRIAHTA